MKEETENVVSMMVYNDGDNNVDDDDESVIKYLDSAGCHLNRKDVFCNLQKVIHWTSVGKWVGYILA